MRERQNPFSEEEICNFVSQLVQGLAHMHKVGYFHRDLKPGKILILVQLFGPMHAQFPGSISFSIFNTLEEFYIQVLDNLLILHTENLLVTDDVLKIADFGLSREVASMPPYTEYVSTRW